MCNRENGQVIWLAIYWTMYQEAVVLQMKVKVFCMEWHKDLYSGESILKRQRKVKWKIMHGAGQLRVYVITLASNEENLLDIIPSKELLQKYYPKEGLYVVGLAGSYREALEVACRIVNEVYQSTGGFDVRGYLRRQGKQAV